MQFHGPITPGGPEVQLSGTAKEIYEQILVLNPDYDVFAFPDSAKKLADSGVTRENIDNPSPEVSTTAAVRARNVLKRQDGVSVLKIYVRLEGDILIRECTDQLSYWTSMD